MPTAPDTTFAARATGWRTTRPSKLGAGCGACRLGNRGKAGGHGRRERRCLRSGRGLRALGRDDGPARRHGLHQRHPHRRRSRSRDAPRRLGENRLRPAGRHRHGERGRRRQEHALRQGNRLSLRRAAVTIPDLAVDGGKREPDALLRPLDRRDGDQRRTSAAEQELRRGANRRDSARDGDGHRDLTAKTAQEPGRGREGERFRTSLDSLWTPREKPPRRASQRPKRGANAVSPCGYASAAVRQATRGGHAYAPVAGPAGSALCVSDASDRPAFERSHGARTTPQATGDCRNAVHGADLRIELRGQPLCRAQRPDPVRSAGAALRHGRHPAAAVLSAPGPGQLRWRRLEAGLLAGADQRLPDDLSDADRAHHGPGGAWRDHRAGHGHTDRHHRQRRAVRGRALAPADRGCRRRACRSRLPCRRRQHRRDDGHAVGRSLLSESGCSGASIPC